MTTPILIVDDSASFLAVIQMALSDAGYEVIQASNGKEALTKLDGRKYSLIISDVNMPIMDGLSFVRAARQIPAYKYTPIVMLTTEDGADVKAEGKAAGVRGWIVKPFKAPVLLDAVKKLASP